MNNLTASEIAGFGLEHCFYVQPFLPPRLILSCLLRKQGLVKEGGPISFTFIDDMYESLGGDCKVNTIRCSKCQAGGRFCCPDFSKVDSD
ncbi:hypothetical protein SADUNF_Sadunf04G0073900 [Salix dunnii]|uniref:Uncharacterized protein n=1 Tax=Salix dunnii TaxID=1413687 RepID=A0A835KDM5_9ROSI|nr:hypothetical protein SADUNF_Sadunf04G0073900 [Salix dunnii]